MSGSEREKIDAHLSSIRDIEKTLQDPDRNGFCEVTQQPPTTIDVYDNDTLHMRFKAHIDILVSALACDQTRVATLTAEGGAGMAQPKWIGLGAKHHDMSHGGAGWDRLYHWYAEQLAYLIQKLKAVPESNGTLFDNTAIAWVNEMGLGSHSMGDLPYLIAGSCGDQFRTGRFVDVSGAKEIGFLFNLLHAMGIYTNTMELASGNPIPNLLRG